MPTVDILNQPNPTMRTPRPSLAGEELLRVLRAVRQGDFSARMSDRAGRNGEIARTLNEIIAMNESTVAEFERMSRVVGKEGKLRERAALPNARGGWLRMLNAVNSLIADLVQPTNEVARVIGAVAKGNLSQTMPLRIENRPVRGAFLQMARTVNTVVEQLNAFASEVNRVAREVGTEGKLGGQAEVRGVAGVWKDLTDNVNLMASNLTSQVRNIADVTTAVARGDLSKKITVEVKGEILQLKNTINTMVDQLNAFGSEVTRVAREVGTEGKLGGQAKVKGVAGVWKDLTDNVNLMASNLTTQVRRIASVVTAVAKGDLKTKLSLEARGEIATLADTINNMIDTLAIFADQVTTVAREVGVEGQLGGQARVPGATGIWRDLTDNVNQLAANLTTQVRAIADVATAVTKGELTQSIRVEARGEVESLKDNINEMIRNLRETTQKNAEQDWLKTNLAKFTRMLQGQRDLETVSRQILTEMAPLVDAQHGVFYLYDDSDPQDTALRLLAGYAYSERDDLPKRFHPGEGLVGQCALEKKKILVNDAPAGYIAIRSGLGQERPSTLVVLPVLFESQVKAVIELASFNRFSPIHLNFLEQLTESIGIVLNNIAATMRTEALLTQSQALTQELQQTNAELEEKAEQLALTSKYKSEFLANMSHELRTPLNSLLILAKMLYENPEGNLTSKQVEFARAIHSSGTDLLALINDILDLSKIESGTMAVEIGKVRFRDLHDDVESSFRPIAQNKKLDFTITVDPEVSPALQTDSKRLQQVLRNLLSNAFKFTERGGVSLDIRVAHSGWSEDHPMLSGADAVIAFAVRDTGIGIPVEKHQIIFEPFQQADMTTSRKYGGTGLGLSISREIARLLGGEIRLESAIGKGSTFTLYLPLAHDGAKRGRDTASAATVPARAGRIVAAEPGAPGPESATDPGDDRARLLPADRVLLIVEDDPDFARLLLEQARDHGFKGLIAEGGEAALELARRFKPHAISLDLRLPDMDGWAVLDMLKHDPETLHIPVHIISQAEQMQRGLKQGAFAYLRKPVTEQGMREAFSRMHALIDQRVKRLLVVEDDPLERSSIVELLAGDDVETTAVGSGGEACEVLRAKRYDCMVLDLKLPDMTGFELLERLYEVPHHPPTVIYTGKDLAPDEEKRLRTFAETIIIKDAMSPEKLLSETALFLHRVASDLPEAKRRMLAAMHHDNPALAGRTVLIADDDIRNIYALTTVLERNRMRVLYAQTGREAVDLLKGRRDVDLVLMDIMMPEMDGYEAMAAIRAIDAFKDLPIIALTAKAMKGDRERCLEAGASDYVPKPVDTTRLLSLLRVWLESTH